MKTNMDWIKRVHLPILAVISVGILCTAEDVYYVKPTEALDGNKNFNPEALCPDSPCYPLDYYVQDKHHYFTSNIRFQLLPGVHRLDMGPGESLIDIRNVSNLTLTGSKVFRMVAGLETPESVILCASRIAFLFTYTESLSISHLTIFNCGSLPYAVSAFAVGLFNVTNTHLSHMLISKSSGYGILGHNILGISSITNSVVFGSQDSESYLGGNTAVYFNPSESDHHRLGNDTIQFTIKSTSFAHGLASQFESKVGGLAIYLSNPYSNSYVSLYNVSFHDNVHRTWNNDTTAGGIYIGANLLIVIFEWKCTSNFVSIDNCTFHRGVAARGGGVQMVILPLGPNNTCSYTIPPPSNFIRIANSNVTSNIAYAAGGGVYVTFLQSPSLSHHQSYLQLIGVMFENNECSLNGGNAYLSSTSSDEQYKIEIRDCVFRNGKAVSPAAAGGGLSLVLVDSLLGLQSNTEILLTQTEFLGNSGSYGGGVAIYIYPVKTILASSDIVMINCTFRNNLGSRGSALLVQDLDYDVQLPTIQSSITFINLTVVDNGAGFDENCPKCDSRAFEFLYAKNVTFFNAELHNNNVGAVRLYGSILNLGGTVRFTNNTGFKGAGIEICTDSYMYLKRNTYVSFTNNHARYAGGAIYVKGSECDREGDGTTKCFLNINYSYNSSSHTLPQISFANNTAAYAGTALYGGNVDNCIPTEQFQRDTNEVRRGKLNAEDIDWAPKGSKMFDLLFKFNQSRQSDLSVVSSHPIVICLCENEYPNCTIKQMQASAFPGETFSVYAVAVGQRNGVVPGVANAVFTNYSDSHTLDDFQTSQNVGSTCTVLNFTVFSNSSIEDLRLKVETPDRHFIALPPSLSITLLSCPPGFTLRGPPPRFKCDCVKELISLGTSCNIDQGTIHRPTTVWIGYYQSENANSTSGILLHEHCPYDYCRPEDIDIKLDYSDEQCAFNRSGVLCGACKTGLSVVLSTSQCFDCSNRYFAQILVMLLAGLVLIFILTALDFTISDGTISGLIFYANIVHTNKVSFFQFKTSFLSVFIAWLNFDWGIETCFYDGMDMYARTWLQFVFPLYIWGIVTFMIVSSHYSTTAAKLFGRNNSVRVLATLILVSYTKILRTIITVLSFTTLTYPDKSVKFLWLADANIEYLTGKHIPLFLVALIFLFFSLLYTTLLLFLQCLWPRSHYRLLSWIRKIKPFLDAHTGPYNDKYRFWIGVLFLVRITLFMGFAANSLGDPSLNLLLVVIVIMCILGCKWIASGIKFYKIWFLDTLEVSFFLNLGLLSATTAYIQSINEESKVQDIIVSASVGVAFVIFFGILVYHTRNCLPQTVMRIKNSLLYCCMCAWKRQQTEPEANSEHVELIEDNEDNANIPAGNYEAFSGESLAQSQPPVQCVRLTFDRQATSGEAEFEPL